MKVVQRFPNFFSGFTPEKYEVATLEELKKLPFVEKWINKDNFYRLSISRSHRPQALLMCELDEGQSFWAIAFLTEHNGFDLPNRVEPANKVI
jgi:hypothetical protein